MIGLLALTTPINLNSEKEKFFASSSYHPIFHYIWQGKNIKPTFSNKLKYPLWDAVHAQDHKAIVMAASRLFEVELSQALLTQAHVDAHKTGVKSEGKAKDVAELFLSTFKEFDIDYTIELSDKSGFNVRPVHNERQIIISRDLHLEYFSAEALVHHELVHIVRHLNGKHNKIKRSQRFLPTEEGLASWCQDNTNDDNGLAQHAMEYIASSVGVRGSLRDIYDCFCDLGMSSELAWKRACRHKFGFVDTAKPGDILKPAMYYQNEQKISQLSSDEKLRLFVGKINIDELPDYPTYHGIWKPDHLQDYYHL